MGATPHCCRAQVAPSVQVSQPSVCGSSLQVSSGGASCSNKPIVLMTVRRGLTWRGIMSSVDTGTLPHICTSTPRRGLPHVTMCRAFVYTMSLMLRTEDEHSVFSLTHLRNGPLVWTPMLALSTSLVV